MTNTNKWPVVRVEVEARTKRELEEICDRRGMSQLEVTSRLVRWAEAQDDLTLAVALGTLTEAIARQMGPSLLERIAQSAGKGDRKSDRKGDGGKHGGSADAGEKQS